MEKTDNSAYWLAFASIEEVGAAFIRKVYEHFGSIKSAWCAGPDNLYRIEDITKKQMDVFLRKRAGVEPEKCLEFIQKRGIKFINFEDENYPKLLKEIHNPPMTLFYKGDFSRCNLDKTLAVVGSRRASEGAKNTLSRILGEFAGTDICIVSGLAAGIDTCAHKSAIEFGLSTIAVIGSGFDFVYPKANKELFKEIEEKAGVIISEYWPTEEPLPWRFPLRNRIVSGLCKGTLVAEAALKSGALITANLCIEQNRELMCLPGLVSNPNTEGVYKLLKNGAALVTEGKDILDTLGWKVEILKPEEEKNAEIAGMSENEAAVFGQIAIEDCSADALEAALGIEMADLMVILTTLELENKIKQTNGGKYTLV